MLKGSIAEIRGSEEVSIKRATNRTIRTSRPIELPEAEERRAIRRSVRLTQRQVGELVGVTGQMVGFWEVGKNEPTGENRARYAELLEACQEAAP